MSVQGRTVLVVEDDPAVWRALEDLLLRAGAIVVQTPDCRAREILATRHPPDAVVLDVHAAAEVRACLAAEVHLRDVPLVAVPSDAHLWLAQQRRPRRARTAVPARWGRPGRSCSTSKPWSTEQPAERPGRAQQAWPRVIRRARQC